MIKLREVILPVSERDSLANYQNTINQQADYTTRVEEAKRIWGNRPAVLDRVREHLKRMTPGIQRCCYCEDAEATDIEHFRHKVLYPQYTFVWENYLLACGHCNSHAKKDKFAVFDSEGQKQDVTRIPNQPMNEPIEGKAVLINPCFEDPLDFLRVDLLSTFYIQPCANLSNQQHEQAIYTIEVLNLNRDELKEWRELAFRNFVGWGDTYRRYHDEQPERLSEHQRKLAKYSHLAVWYEMQRVYRNRKSNWKSLTERYPNLKEIDRLFNEFPDLLDQGV